MEEHIIINVANSKPKRVRAANYSMQERKLLLGICKRFEEALKCKKTDIISVRRKDQIWEKVTRLFNQRSTSGIWRDKVSLKGHYENSKRKNRTFNNKLATPSFSYSGCSPNSNTEDESNTSHHEFVQNSLNDPCDLIAQNRNNYKNEDNISIDGQEFVVKTEEELHDEYETRHKISEDDTSKQYTKNNSTPVLKIVGHLAPSNKPNDLNGGSSLTSTNIIAKIGNETDESLRRIESMLINEDPSEVLSLQTIKLTKDLLESKTRMVDFQLEREKAEFHLRKRALELDIQIREKYLEKLNSIDSSNINSLPKLL